MRYGDRAEVQLEVTPVVAGHPHRLSLGASDGRSSPEAVFTGASTDAEMCPFIAFVPPCAQR